MQGSFCETIAKRLEMRWKQMELHCVVSHVLTGLDTFGDGWVSLGTFGHVLDMLGHTHRVIA